MTFDCNYFNSLFHVGVIAYYDGPIETIVGKNPADEYCVSEFDARSAEYHYGLKVWHIDDYARYLLKEITCNELEDRMVCGFRTMLDADGAFEHLDEMSVDERTDYQTHKEYLYYADDAKDHEALMTYFGPTIQRV